MKHYVEGTTCDMGHVEEEFDGESALRDACIKAQNIEEDGGSATVTDEAGKEIDHWNGYRIHIDPASGTDQTVGLVFEAGLLVELNVIPQENQDGQGQDC